MSCRKVSILFAKKMNLDAVSTLANQLESFHMFERVTRRTFGLALTNKCAVGCLHCINNSRSNGNAEITLAQIRKLCEEIKASDEFDTVNMTGGEPFENVTLLNHATSIIASYGFKPTVVTSASWAQSSEVAHNLLTVLYESGLQVMVISRDEFHEPHVPHQYVVHALRNALQLGICSALTLTTGEGLKGFDDLLKPISEQLRPDEFSQIEIMESGLLRSGRAAKLPAQKFASNCTNEPSPLYCPVSGPMLLPNGEFVSCCRAELPAASLLRRGHCDTTNASEMARSINTDPIVRMIRYFGLRRMANLLGPEEFSPSTRSFISSAGTADLCAVCNCLLAVPDRVARLRSFAQDPALNSEMAIIAAVLYGDNTTLEIS